VEQWEEKEGMKTALLKKVIQWEMKKMDTQCLKLKRKVNVTKKLSNTHKTTLKEEIWEEILRKFVEKI
jgi:hypothetical protein